LTATPNSLLETPCIDVCEMDTVSGLCVGCGRTLEEIARWSVMSGEERRAIMAELAARIALSGAMKG
jgi:predicted Fe-S protein YdhL (DUF1289 family)